MKSSWDKERTRYIRAERRKKAVMIFGSGFIISMLIWFILSFITYNLWYEGMVEDTIRDMVKKKL